MNHPKGGNRMLIEDIFRILKNTLPNGIPRKFWEGLSPENLCQIYEALPGGNEWKELVLNEIRDFPTSPMECSMLIEKLPPGSKAVIALSKAKEGFKKKKEKLALSSSF